jgi:NAD(P)H dehydrogenase (quinone)
MSVVVTGATGHLGRLIVESLLERGLPAAEITAAGRSVGKLDDLAAQGVTIAAIDYEDPATLEAAFTGADVVVLVSGNEFGRRAAQHGNAIAVAEKVGVGRLVYTSIPKATETPMLLAQEHRATEEILTASGLTYTIVRNSWYVENYTPQIPTYLQHGVVGSAGDGRVSLATRKDYAEAAAAVALGEGHEGKVYELGGEAVTLTELASIVSEATGHPVSYTEVPAATLQGILEGAGFPAPVAATFADVDTRIAEGDLHVTSGDLERLIGRPATPVRDAVAAAV